LFLQVFDRLQKLGLTVEYGTTLTDADKIAEHFDTQLIGLILILSLFAMLAVQTIYQIILVTL